MRESNARGSLEIPEALVQSREELYGGREPLRRDQGHWCLVDSAHQWMREQEALDYRVEIRIHSDSSVYRAHWELLCGDPGVLLLFKATWL